MISFIGLLLLANFANAQPAGVLLFRHGNKEDTIVGCEGYEIGNKKPNWCKTLTKDGFADALSVANYLRAFTGDNGPAANGNYNLYTSPFRRAIMTASCFADESTKKIRIDRSLGETKAEKHQQHGAYDFVAAGRDPATTGILNCSPYESPYNCHYKNEVCGDGSGTLNDNAWKGPNCDNQVVKTVELCRELRTEGWHLTNSQAEWDTKYNGLAEKTTAYSTGVKIIDRDYKQADYNLQACTVHGSDKTACESNVDPKCAWVGPDGQESCTGLSVGWQGKVNKWRNDKKPRLKYMWEHIINHSDNTGKWVIIIAHGRFNEAFMNTYVEPADSWRQQNVNTGTMHKLIYVPSTQEPGEKLKGKLKAVGERYSFLETSDLMMAVNPTDDQSGLCKIEIVTVEYSRFQGTSGSGKVVNFRKINPPRRDVVAHMILKLNDKGQGDCYIEYIDCKAGASETTCLMNAWYSPAGIQACRFTASYPIFKQSVPVPGTSFKQWDTYSASGRQAKPVNMLSRSRWYVSIAKAHWDPLFFNADRECAVQTEFGPVPPPLAPGANAPPDDNAVAMSASSERRVKSESSSNSHIFILLSILFLGVLLVVFASSYCRQKSSVLEISFLDPELETEGF